MPVKMLELDDRTFKDLFEEVRSLIPRYAPGWTDHNVSDPGIMLLELFAWLTEAMLYRINRVPDASRMRLLEMLGAVFQPAQPAFVDVRVCWAGSVQTCTDGESPSKSYTSKSYVLKRGTKVMASFGMSSGVPFEVTRDVRFTCPGLGRTVSLRQTEEIVGRELNRVSPGGPFESSRWAPVTWWCHPSLGPRPRECWWMANPGTW